MVVALLPGGFKPPHAGHYEAAKYLADYADKVLIKIGPSNRGGGLKYEPLGIDIEGGVTPEIAKEFWEEYIKHDSDPRKNKIEIELSSLDTPVRDVYDYIENPPNDVSKVVLGLGEKESGTRYQGVPKAAQASNIEYEIIKIPSQAGGASGSATRDFVITQNEKDFINNIPKFLPDEVKDGMWNLLTQRVKLSSEKEKELKKKISSHKSKVRRALKKKLTEFMGGTMNAEEMAKHLANMKKLKNFFSKQGDQMVPVPRELTKGLRRKLYEKDPKVGTGKKPKGSGRRLYTDENPNDTVKVKFSSRQDIVDTLSKKSFKSKSHARQSQIINLIHQRVRAAYGRAKDPDIKKRLKTALDYITKRKEASKEKTKRMRKEETFSKEWWLNIITEEFLNEGGAAGHMAHPFDLPNVNTGKDLIKSFEQAADSLKKTPGSVKIDGVNASIRLVNFDGKREFAMDRGSKKALDLKGVTKADLEDRFGAGHGMIKAGGNVLDIFNDAKNTIQPELEALGMWDNPNVMFNMEYVSGKSNVQDYGKNFLAIHGLLEVETKEVEGKSGKMLTKRIASEKKFNESDMDKLLKKLEPFAKKKGFEIYGSVPTTFTKDPDFKSALGTNYTIDFAEGDQTKSLAQWLNGVTSIPKTDRLKMNVNGAVKDVGALSKQVYFAVFGGENVDDLFDSEQDVQKAIQGATTYLATEKLGDAILDVLDSPMGSVNDHEGVVIRDPKISNNPFKITGKFITGGVSSQFQQK